MSSWRSPGGPSGRPPRCRGPAREHPAGPAAPEQLAQVVDRDDEHPLGLHRLEPPEAGAAEPAGLLDLAEDGSTIALRRA